jgi:hypothetical protein
MLSASIVNNGDDNYITPTIQEMAMGANPARFCQNEVEAADCF